jgi:hypothetical protein
MDQLVTENIYKRKWLLPASMDFEGIVSHP